MLLFLLFQSDLLVIIIFHLLTVLYYDCAALLVFNMICNDILQSQHVPCVILLRLDMARLSLLEPCLRVVEVCI